MANSVRLQWLCQTKLGQKVDCVLTVVICGDDDGNQSIEESQKLLGAGRVLRPVRKSRTGVRI